MTFANQLRGIAALLVVWLHLGVHYWSGSGFAASTLGVNAPPARAQIPTWSNWSHQFAIFTGVDFGALGVALFFLISGFVIPISLRKLTPARFLLARVVRIFPTYILSFIIVLFVWWLVSKMSWGPSRPDVSMRDVVSQAFLVGDFMATQLLDLVSWTLQIELKFYLISALIATSLVNNKLHGIYAFALVSIAGAALHRWPVFNVLLSTTIGPNTPFIYKQLFVQAGFVVYIFCGYVFLLYYEGQISLQSTLKNVCVLFLLSVGIEKLCSVPTDVLKTVAWNQLIAGGIFLAALCWYPNGKGIYGLNFVAKISFPLYLVHIPIGWGTLLLFQFQGVEATYSVIAALLASFFVAWLLHLSAERPSMRLIESVKRTRPAPISYAAEVHPDIPSSVK